MNIQEIIKTITVKSRDNTFLKNINICRSFSWAKRKIFKMIALGEPIMKQTIDNTSIKYRVYLINISFLLIGQFPISYVFYPLFSGADV